MIYTCKPERVAIYVNRDSKRIDEIKAETGCDVIINGGLFTLATWTPVCHLKADGHIYAADQWRYFGYGWHTGKADLRLTADYATLDNYICCVCLIRDGKKEKLTYPAAMGGARPRTALGLFPDGRMWFYAASEGKTPESLQTLALNLGLDSCLMLDGGASTQGISPSGSLRQTRRCHNFICAWLDTPACPYPEPSALIGRGNVGDGTRWLQYMLNLRGAHPPLTVDGIYGGKTYAAVVTFQTAHGLKADGIVGALTRAALKEPSGASEIITPNYKWARTPSTRGTTEYIILHHAAGDATPEAIHNAHLANGWCGIGYNMYIRKSGKIYLGRPLDAVGAHTVGYNIKSIGICFEGNFEEERMSDVQIAAGKKAIEYARRFYPNTVIKLHKECDATACPGKYFPASEFRP